jgi:hypothetical protein
MRSDTDVRWTDLEGSPGKRMASRHPVVPGAPDPWLAGSVRLKTRMNRRRMRVSPKIATGRGLGGRRGRRLAGGG